MALHLPPEAVLKPQYTLMEKRLANIITTPGMVGLVTRQADRLQGPIPRGLPGCRHRRTPRSVMDAGPAGFHSTPCSAPFLHAFRWNRFSSVPAQDSVRQG